MQLGVLGTDADGVKLYSYDSYNRLKTYTDGVIYASYTYDGNNLRQSKTVNCVTTNHIWDGSNMVMETKGTTVNKYYRGATGLMYSDIDGERRYYHKDEHGNVAAMTNAAGNVINVNTYDAFGNMTQTNESITDPFGYCGEYYDKELDALYLRNRYYSPSIGRFITEDPIKDGLNWYAYAGNNPIMFVDPSGLEGESEFDLKYIINIISEHHENDKQGRQILLWYLFGDGENHFIDNDPEWTMYMEANAILRTKVNTILLEVFNGMENGSSQWIDMTLPMSIENGENAIGYEFLHGTNNDLQAYKDLGATVDDVGFRIIGNVQKDNNGVIKYSLAFEWNDIMDPNFEYTTDKAKSEFAKKIPLAEPQNYILRIKWNEQGVYNNKPGFRKITWPFTLFG